MKFKQIMLIGVGVLLGGTLSIATAVNANPSKGNNSISEINSEEAKKIMLNKVPGAKITKFEFDSDEKIKKYDGTLIKDNTEYEIDVDSKTGKIIKFEEENIKIGKDNIDKNTTSQENNKEYEISIDAKTGDIVDFSEEVIKTPSSVNQSNTNNTVNKPVVNQNNANKYFDDDRHDNDVDDKYDDDKHDNDIDDKYDDDSYND